MIGASDLINSKVVKQ